MDGSTFNKVQHQFWVTKQTVYRKLGKKEDEWIVASDAILDAKLELFKSIQLTSSAVNKLLDRYQEKICSLAQEQNAMGRFLKEYGKTDKSEAGQMMIQMGKSLISCSQQEIGLRPPLLRLYQEVETFRNRAVEDTIETVFNMERYRTEYRASLNWMKNVSQELDPDTSKHLEKFRKVQTHVKNSKAQFEKLKLACLQKVDLLAAARCNMFSHALIQYHGAMTKNATKNENIYNLLAQTFEGQHHFDFSVVKELSQTYKKPSESNTQNTSDELLFDFGEELPTEQGSECTSKSENASSIYSNKDKAGEDTIVPKNPVNDSLGAIESGLLEDLLDEPVWINNGPAADNAVDALDMFLGLTANTAEPGSSINTSHSSSLISGKNPVHDQEVEDLLGKDLESSFENSDTAALFKEISSSQLFANQAAFSPFGTDEENRSSTDPALARPMLPLDAGTFLPSQLLDFGHLQQSGDLLNFNDLTANCAPQWVRNGDSGSSTSKNPSKSWHDIFASLDPIANPDAIGKKETEGENRYC